MARRQQAVNAQEPIVDLNTGVASDYFKRVILDRGIGLDDLNGRQILGGTGIDGGGELADGDITLDANVQEILDTVSTTHGVILYRGAADWVPLSPGTNGYVLTTHGAGADPTWAAVTATGTVTSVDASGGTTGFSFTGGPITTSGTLTLTVNNASTVRTSLGLVIGTDVQAYDSDLAAIAALTTTTFGRSLLTQADFEALRAVGVNVQTAPSSQSGTSYTAVLGDAGGYIQFTNGSAVTFTIPPNASVAFPIGTVITAEQNGAGTVTFTAGAGVTLHSRGSVVATAGQYAVAQAKKVATNTWTLIGDLA